MEFKAKAIQAYHQQEYDVLLSTQAELDQIASRGISVAYCGSDELHEVPYVYSEPVQDPEGG